MQNTRSDKSADNSSRAVAVQGKGGLSMPAVPVLQQKKPDETQSEPLQLVTDEEIGQTPVQGKFNPEHTENKPSKRSEVKAFAAPVQKRANDTGLPDQLKSGVESLSGMSMDHVKVHYNSDKPSQLQAHAYAQGSDIHVAPGQERHLAHEAWHVVQQAQGRVKPTMQMKMGVPVNDDAGLEHEADVMGAKALSSGQVQLATGSVTVQGKFEPPGNISAGVTQLHLATDLNSGKYNVAIAGETHHAIPEVQEQAAWGKAGITVHYEGDTIPVGDNAEVTPDPAELRLPFAYAALAERVIPYADKIAKPGKNDDKLGAGDADWVLTYLLPILINELGRDEENEAAKEPVEVLQDLARLLRGGKLTNVQGDELARTSLARKLKRDLALVGRFVSEVHAKTAFKGVPMNSEPLQVARSQQMLGRINTVAGGLANTIYKIGNNHVLDIQRERWAPGPKVAVLERSEYITQYETIPKKGVVAPQDAGLALPVAASSVPVDRAPAPKSKAVSNAPQPSQAPSIVIDPSPASKSKGASIDPSLRSPVSGGGVPLSVSPSPGLSEPKKKPRAKTTTAEPKAPVKSAYDIKVDRMQLILDAAPGKVKEAKGYIEIRDTLALIAKTTADRVVAQVARIIQERNDRWGITKLIVRSKETQQFYDDIAGVLG